MRRAAGPLPALLPGADAANDRARLLHCGGRMVLATALASTAAQVDLFLLDARADDVIISAGYNIAGPEVEDALLRHPRVAECGVIGVADEERGQIVKACVVLKAGKTKGSAEEVSAAKTLAAEYIRDSLFRLGPTFVKLGQVATQ